MQYKVLFNLIESKVCKTKQGSTKCGDNCTQLIEVLKNLQKQKEMKKEVKKEVQKEMKKEKTKKVEKSDYKEETKSESESFEEYDSEEDESDESFGEYSSEEDENVSPKKGLNKKGPEGSKKGGMGLSLKKGQKLNHKQLNIIESASQVRETSTNPLCKEKSNLFRS